jgi:hypothetical protein
MTSDGVEFCFNGKPSTKVKLPFLVELLVSLAGFLGVDFFDAVFFSLGIFCFFVI